MKYYLIITLALSISFSVLSQDIQKAISEKITSNNLLKTVTTLSSKQYTGRLAGSPGFNKAAKFISNEFSKIGLKHFGKDYFQKFKIEYNDISFASYQMINSKGKQKKYKMGDDFVCRGFSGSGNITSDVVFCGYGTSNDSNYNDYKDVDVKGKIVLIFKYSPKWGKGWIYNNPREKTNFAASLGAKGVLFISLPNDAKPQKPIGSTISGKGNQNETVPQLHIDLKAANDLLDGTGYTLKMLQTLIDSSQKPFCLQLNSKANINVKANYDIQKTTMNTIGYIEGSDSILKNHFIVLGAHLDHVGTQFNLLFPGANDNASGSAAVLEIARSFVRQAIHPKYSIIFVLFSDEEHGLDGANFFVKNPIVPIKNIDYMLNMDCIGFGDSIQIGGGKSNPELWRMIKNLDSLNSNTMVNDTWAGGGADAEPFFNAGIKTAYFVTTNSYEHLHLPSDKAETLNKNLFEKITRLACSTLYNLSK